VYATHSAIRVCYSLFAVDPVELGTRFGEATHLGKNRGRPPLHRRRGLPTTLIRLEKYTGRIGAVALCRNTKALGA